MTLRRLAPILLLALVPAGVIRAATQLDRDWPWWRFPALWGWPAAEVPASPPLPRLVLAVFYPWYGTPAGPTGRWRHWDHPRLSLPSGRILGFHDPGASASGRPSLGAVDTPEGGPYDSRDPAIIARQLDQARQAGLDVLLVSWWGRESREAWTFDLVLHAARAGPVRLAPYYETGELWRRGPDGVAADLLWLLDRHRGDPAWLRVGETPVVFLYAAHRLRAAGWEHVRRRLALAGRRLYLVAEAPGPAWLRAHSDWAAHFDAFHVYTPAVPLARGRDLTGLYAEWTRTTAALGRPFVPAVGPGFDDRAIRTPGTFVDRRGGLTYDVTWRAALAADPRWIVVSTWNEWHEGSEIEPDARRGRLDLSTTRAWADRFRSAR